MKNKFVLVDFQNVQPKDFSLLSGSGYKIKVFLGANQGKIPLDMARALQAYGPDVEYIQIDGDGKNALDFHIAYYIGQLAAQMPDASFHVISKDAGFDPLLQHLRARKTWCQRSESITDIARKLHESDSIAQKVDAVIDNLVRQKTAKPRTLRTLESAVKARFANHIQDEEVKQLIEHLTERGTIRVVEGKLQYDLP